MWIKIFWILWVFFLGVAFDQWINEREKRKEKERNGYNIWK